MVTSTKQTFDTVSALIHRLRSHIGGEFDAIDVSGEISNLYRASSGHYYFTLKDRDAQIKCAWFRPGKKADVLNEAVNAGQEIIARGRIDMYPPQGSIQLILSDAEIVGKGDLNAQFEALYKLLSTAGYFADEHKVPLPKWPNTVGIVTSPTGAAIRDIIAVFRRRYPGVRLVIAPSRVQGAGSEGEIANAIARLDGLGVDAIIVGRGGGSLEDLWAFNEEVVVKAIFKCQAPVVSGVGHETDITLSDLVADLRAATPTAAAEALAPDTAQLAVGLANLERRMRREFTNQILMRRQRLDALEAKIIHPRTRIDMNRQRLYQAEQRLRSAIKQELAKKRQRTAYEAAQLSAPSARVADLRFQLERLDERVQHQLRLNLEALQRRLAVLSSTLEALSPDNTLARGYSIISDHEGKVIPRTTAIAAGEAFNVLMQDGQFGARRD